MDAIASARVSEFMSSYLGSEDIDASTDPHQHAALEQSLSQLRLLDADLQRVQSMLDEIESQRGFIQWMNSRIQEAEQRGEDSYLFKWDRSLAHAKILEIRNELPALLGPSLDARLVSSREAFRLNYLDSGVLGRTSGWAGNDPAIQDALEGMLLPESAQTVVNQYLYSIGKLQHDGAWLAQALAPGGSLARSPQRKEYESTLSFWQAQAGTQAQTVLGILSGDIEPSGLDPIPWSERPDMDATTTPPITPSERKAFQWEEDSAWLRRLTQEARSLEDEIASAARQQGRGQRSDQVREQRPQRYALSQKARLTQACIEAVQARLARLSGRAAYGDDALRTVDLDVAHAKRMLDTFNAQTPVGNTQAPPPVSPDDAVYNTMVPFFQSARTQLLSEQQSLAGTIERLSRALEVPRGFRLSEDQRAELALLRSQRAVLKDQRQRGMEELSALEALIDRASQSQQRGEAFDHAAFFGLQAAWDTAKAARQSGEEASHGALTTPPPSFVAWQQSPRSSRSRAPTVENNYRLSPEDNAAVRDRITEDRKTCAALRDELSARDAAIRAAEARVSALTDKAATPADKADAPSAQTRLSALKLLRSVLVNRLRLLQGRLSGNETLRTSSSDSQIARQQQAVLTADAALPDVWLNQLRAQRSLAQSELTVAQRDLAKLQGVAGTPYPKLLEAQRVLTFRERASTYAAASVLAQEASRGTPVNGAALDSARQALASARQGMQAAYFDLVQLRLVYRTDSLRSQLQARQASDASVDEVVRLQKELDMAEVSWPRNLSPFPATATEKAAAVQAQFGDSLPE